MHRLFALFITLLATPAFAETSPYEPVNKGLGMIAAATPVKHQIHDLHNMLLVIIIAISVFVLALLAYTVIRFNKRNNPVPSTTTHHTMLEVIWTAIPVIILLVIAIPSMKLLYYSDRAVEADMTIKAEGHQWYWSYEYPDHGVKFDARALWDTPQTTDADAKKLVAESKPSWLIDNGEPRRLLETDNRLVVPVGTTVRVLVSAADVIHSWAVPAFGVKMDAMPGHLNETWFKAEVEGVFYGQCSEICGTGHGYMPIAIEVVSQERFKAWIEQAKLKFAENGTTIVAQQ